MRNPKGGEKEKEKKKKKERNGPDCVILDFGSFNERGMEKKVNLLLILLKL